VIPIRDTTLDQITAAVPVDVPSGEHCRLFLSLFFWLRFLCFALRSFLHRERPDE
jgi:hypothetical protein